GSVMVLPLALVVLDFYPLRRLGGPWREWIRPPARAVWLEKIPFFVLGVAGGAITYYAQSSNSFITSLARSPLSARPAMVLYSYLPGLGLALVVGAATGAAVQLKAAGRLRPSLAGALAGLGMLWICGLAYLSAQQVQIWRDTENLWRYALESDPNCAICRGNI